MTIIRENGETIIKMIKITNIEITSLKLVWLENTVVEQMVLGTSEEYCKEIFFILFVGLRVHGRFHNHKEVISAYLVFNCVIFIIFIAIVFNL